MAAEFAAECGICLFSVLFCNVWDPTDIDLEFKNSALGKKKKDFFSHQYASKLTHL